MENQNIKTCYNNIPSIQGTGFCGNINDVNYTQLVNVLGEPTHPNESPDGKTQKQWVIKFNGNVYAIYDWKTYDPHFTVNELTTWRVGGKTNADEFITHIENLIKKEMC